MRLIRFSIAPCLHKMHAWIVFCCVIVISLATCPTDYTCSVDFNRCYKFVNAPEEFFAAEENCKAFGGHLLSLRSAFETFLVEETAESMFVGYTDYWIGAMLGSGSNWTWLDGTQWSYTNWLPNEPDGKPVAMSNLGQGSWSSASPTLRKPYVCGLPLTQTTLSTPTCPAPVTCPTPKPQPLCDDGWVHFSPTQSCYKTIMQNKSFLDSELECIREGGHLASIHSKLENDFIADILRTSNSQYGNGMVWIGLSLNGDVWSWTDGTPFDYYDWAPGEPNDEGQYADCAELYADKSSGVTPGDYYWKWNDIICDLNMRAAVCKKLENI